MEGGGALEASIMKFHCEKALIQEAVSTAARAVPLKSTIPALEGLLLETGPNGTVFITGYDQKTGIRSSFPADVIEEGALVLPARLFGEIIRKMPDDTVLFQEENRMVHLSCGMSEFDLMGLDPEDYPELPTVDTLPGDAMIMEVKFTEFLPKQVKSLLPPRSSELTAASKYVLCCDAAVRTFPYNRTEGIQWKKL